MPTSRCCCGATSISVSGEPSFGAVCHCQDCRRRSGSAFGWSAYFPLQQVAGPEGEFEEYRPEIDAPQVRWFCKSCGTTIAWRTGRFPGLIGVAAGAFIGEALPPPTIINSASTSVPWVEFPSEWRRIG